VRAVRRQPLVKGCRQMLASTIHLTRSTPTPPDGHPPATAIREGTRGNRSPPTGG
jgi:hypothetical protein